MINLLPPDVKRSYRYARRNVVLRRWVLMCLVALVGLGGLTTYGLLTLHQSTNNYSRQIASTEALFQKEDFAGAQQQVLNISNSFKLVVKVLGQEVLFSKLLQQMGATMPAGTSLTGLTIDQVAGGIGITAIATNYTTATQVQVNLADPANKIFTKADIISINCDSGSTVDANYPCTVNLRALFANQNPFLFINSKEASP